MNFELSATPLLELDNYFIFFFFVGEGGCRREGKCSGLTQTKMCNNNIRDLVNLISMMWVV